MGKVFLLVGEVRFFCRVRLSRSFCEWDALGISALAQGIITERFLPANRVRSRTM